jgi:hypothetical protein
MMFNPIDAKIKNNFSYLKDYLLREDKVTLNTELSLMGSCLGLIDAILEGRLIICEEQPDPPAAAPEETE